MNYLKLFKCHWNGASIYVSYMLRSCSVDLWNFDTLIRECTRVFYYLKSFDKDAS